MADSHSECNQNPPTLDQFVFDRLNAALDPGQASEIDGLQKQALDRLGREIRQWRLQKGYTRAVLAGKLQMDVNRLICLENGIAQVGDMPAGQLANLQALLDRDSGTPARS
jgi:hypothetical protein